MDAISQRHFFQMHFLKWKYLNSDWIFTEFCSQESNWQYSSTGSDDGLAPSRRQQEDISHDSNVTATIMGGKHHTNKAISKVMNGWFVHECIIRRFLYANLVLYFTQICICDLILIKSVWPSVPYGVTDFGHHRFKSQPVAYSTPCHYVNQWQLIVHRSPGNTTSEI